MSIPDSETNTAVNKGEKPPKDLSPAAVAWWREIRDNYEFDAGRLVLLDLAAHALTRAENARQTLKKDGPFYTDKHGVRRPHPAALMQKNAESSFTQLFRALRLDKIDEEEAETAKPYIDKRSLNWKTRNLPWRNGGTS